MGWDRIDLLIYEKKTAFAKGINFSQPEKYELLKVIDANTSFGRAKKSNLIQYKQIIDALPDKFQERNIIKALIELKIDKLVGMVPAFQFNEITNSLDPVVYFVSHPEELNVDMSLIYQAVIDQSAEILKKYHNIFFNYDRELFWKDLENSLAEDQNTQVFHTQIYYDFYALLEKIDLPFSIDKTIKDFFVKELIDLLVARGSAVTLYNQRTYLIPFRYLGDIATTLQTFLANKILPRYESIPYVWRKLDLVEAQEQLFLLGNGKRKNYKFAAERASIIENFFIDEKGSGDSPFGGRVVLQLIQKLKEPVNEVFEKQYIDNVFEKVNELKNKIKKESENWKELMLFLDHQELDDYPPEALEKLFQDKELLYTLWEGKSGPRHIFMHLNVENFQMVLDGLATVKPREFWKILAYRKLMYNTERIAPSLNPFYNENFHKKYSALLGTIYYSYMPFLSRFFLSFDINFISSYIFKSVKLAIEKSQTRLRENRLAAEEARKAEQLKDLARLSSQIKDKALKNRISEELDFCYFRQNTVPLVRDIAARFPTIPSEKFKALLSLFQFELIAVHPNDLWMDQILFYPHEITWNYNREKTIEKINEILESERKAAVYNNSDEVVLKRANALYYRLQLG